MRLFMSILIICATARLGAADPVWTECSSGAGPCRHKVDWSCTGFSTPGSCPATHDACSANDCVVSAWSSWSTCDADCGGGFTYRTRTVTTIHSNGGAVCPPLTEWKSCNQQPCTTNSCVMSAWSDWSDCSVECGGGTQTRSRSLVSGTPGCAPVTQSQACNTASCDNCAFCAAGTDGPCQKASGDDYACYQMVNGRCPTGTTPCKNRGADCGSRGTRTSYHRCDDPFLHSGGPCRHPSTSVCHGYSSGTTCPAGTSVCAPTHCAVSDWGAWSDCTVTCGGGKQIRWRKITTPPAHGGMVCPALFQIRDCNTGKCQPKCSTKSYGDRDFWLVDLIQVVLGIDDEDDEDHGSRNNGKCVAVDCVVGDWSTWGVCSAKCGGGTQFRSRAVITTAANGGKACPTLQDSQPCNTSPCDYCTACAGDTDGPCQKASNKVCAPYLYGTTTCPYGFTKCSDAGCSTGGSDVGGAGSGLCHSCYGRSFGCCKHDIDSSCHDFLPGTFDCPTGTTSCVPRDCAVTAWSDWSTCSVSCGGGVQSRTRAVSTTPLHGGAECPVLSESRSCNTDRCVPQCGTCASGTKGPCLVSADGTCVGYLADGRCPAGSRECYVQECVVSEWSAWSACSANCGGGTATRSRAIVVQPSINAAPCPTLSDSRACNSQACAHCIGCAGGTAGPCMNINNKVCYGYNNGTTTCPAGTRLCTDDGNTCTQQTCGNAGNGMCTDCFGISAGPCRHNNDQSCLPYVQGTFDCPVGTTPCMPQNCRVSEWSDWGACSLPCDSGTQSRYRTQLTGPTNGGMECPAMRETRACNTDRCTRVCDNCVGGTSGPCKHNNDGTCVAYQTGVTCPAGTTECANVNCGVSDWSDWSTCSTTCGGGEQYRTRRVVVPASVGGIQCPAAREKRACNTFACKNCAGCAGGTSGPCKNGNNAVCYGYYDGTTTCPAGTYQCESVGDTVDNPCYGNPGDGMCTNCFGESQGPCRHDADSSCFAYVEGTTRCPAGTTPCSPQNCVMSNWSEWSTCTADCGGGAQVRNRAITTPPSNGGAACGPTSESRACNTIACPAACGGCVGNTAGPCRHINDGTCFSISVTGACPAGTLACQDTDCVVSQWSAWSGCSVKCGGGLQTRVRSILTQPDGRGAACPTLSQSRDCNQTPCENCVSCVGGTSGPCKHDNDGTCLAYYAGTTYCPAGSTPCTDSGTDCGSTGMTPGTGMCTGCVGNTHGPCRHNVDSTCVEFIWGTTSCPAGTTVCMPQDCVVSAWSAWSDCTSRCGGGGSRTRTRTIVTQPSNGGAGCPALVEHDVHCNEQPCASTCTGCTGSTSGPCMHLNDQTCMAYSSTGACPAGSRECKPTDCVVSEWSMFGPCSAKCGGGTHTRTRSIVTPAAYGGTACPALSDTQACNPQACSDCAGCAGGSSGPCRRDDDSNVCFAFNAGTTTCPSGTYNCHDHGDSYDTLPSDCGPPGDGMCDSCSRGTSGPCRNDNDGTCVSYDAGTFDCPAGTHTCRTVNCRVGDWSDWSTCTSSCGGGTQYRTRPVWESPKNGGTSCPALRETRTCNSAACVPQCTDCSGSSAGPCKRNSDNVCIAYNANGVCPPDTRECWRAVDCKLSEWSAWSDCSVSCGGGVQTRRRDILVPPANGGNACGAQSEQRACNKDPCYFCAGCSGGTSGPCKHSTQHSCYDFLDGTTVCPLGTVACISINVCLGDVVVDGADPGDGMCDACSGDSHGPCRSTLDDTLCMPFVPGTRSCPALATPCRPINCKVSDWSDWSVCPSTCTPGQQVRRRTITTAPHNGGVGCPSLEDRRDCPVPSSCSTPTGTACVVGPWGDWGTCSATCGGGVQIRSRSVVTPASNGGSACPTLSDSRACNTQDCTFCAGCLAGTAGPCMHYDSPRCYAYLPGTRDCPANTRSCKDNRRSYDCNEVEPGDGKCSGCLANTEGTCRNVDKNICVGFVVGTYNCPAGTVACAPVNCLWSEWSDWSDCDKSCGGGTRTRTRRVIRQPRDGGATCASADTDSIACNTQVCESDDATSVCGPCKAGTSGQCRRGSDNTCHDFYYGTKKCPSGMTAGNLCTRCAGNTMGPCKHRTKGTCAAFTKGLTCPGNHRACGEDGNFSDDDHYDHDKDDDDDDDDKGKKSDKCTGCWPGTSGPCQSSDTVCFDYLPGTTTCPAKSNKCATDGSKDAKPCTIFDVHISGESAIDFDEDEFKAKVCVSAGVDSRNVVVDSVKDDDKKDKDDDKKNKKRRLATTATTGVNVGFVIVTSDPITTQNMVATALQSGEISKSFDGFNKPVEVSGQDQATSAGSSLSPVLIAVIVVGCIAAVGVIVAVVVVVRYHRQADDNQSARPAQPRVQVVPLSNTVGLAATRSPSTSVAPRTSSNSRHGSMHSQHGDADRRSTPRTSQAPPPQPDMGSADSLAPENSQPEPRPGSRHSQHY